MILGPAFLSGEQIPKLLGKSPSGIFITIYGLAMASTQGEQRHNALLRYHLSPIPLGFLFTKLLNTSLTFVYRINSIINIAKKRDRSSQSNSWTFIVFLYAITYQGGDCWIYLLCYFPLWMFGEDQFTSHYYLGAILLDSLISELPNAVCAVAVLQFCKYRLLSGGPIYIQGYLSTCQKPIRDCLLKLISFLFALGYVTHLPLNLNLITC